MTNLELSGTFTKDATNVFDGWTEAQTLTLKSYTASKLAAIDAGALKGCNAKVLDSTGAEVDFDATTGVVNAGTAEGGDAGNGEGGDAGNGEGTGNGGSEEGEAPDELPGGGSLGPGPFPGI